MKHIYRGNVQNHNLVVGHGQYSGTTAAACTVEAPREALASDIDVYRVWILPAIRRVVVDAYGVEASIARACKHGGHDYYDYENGPDRDLPVLPMLRWTGTRSSPELCCEKH